MRGVPEPDPPELFEDGLPVGLLGQHGTRRRFTFVSGEPDETVGRTLVIVVKVPALQTAARDLVLKKIRRPRGRERWQRWKAMLDEGVYESRSALARGEGVSPAAVTQGLQKLAAEEGE